MKFRAQSNVIAVLGEGEKAKEVRYAKGQVISKADYEKLPAHSKVSFKEMEDVEVSAAISTKSGGQK